MNDATAPSAGAGRKRAFGRSLGDFRIEGATTPNGLLPAEEKLLVAVAQGETCRVSDLDWKKAGELEKLKSDAEFTIRATFLRFLALGGDDSFPVHERGVTLARAYVDGTFDLQGCQPMAYLYIIESYFAGSLTLRDAYLKGLSLTGSRVRGIEADRARVGGSLLLRNGFLAEGEVRLFGADIDGDLDCNLSSFRNAGGNALSFGRARISGSVFLIGLVAEGAVNLSNALLGGSLYCQNGRFRNPGGDALNCDGAHIHSAVYLRDGFAAEGTLSFSGTTTQQLVDDDVALGGAGACDLVLDGFVYERFGGDAPIDAKTRLAWLHRQRQGHLYIDFRPKPFQQLAHVLRSMGHLQDSHIILAFMERRSIPLRLRGASLAIRPLKWLLLHAYGITMGFGYRPHRLLFVLLGLWLLGGWVYQQAADQGVFAPAQAWTSDKVDACRPPNGNWTKCPAATELPTFRALAYSGDVLLPIINLGQRKYWEPMDRGFSIGLPFFGKLLIVPGWLSPWLVSLQNAIGSFVALLFGGLAAGLIKRD